MQKKYFFTSVILLILILYFFILKTTAFANEEGENKDFSPLNSRFIGQGLLGSQKLFWGDVLVPFYGNAQTIFYFDAQGKTAFESAWLSSMGSGLRHIVAEKRILGAYIFADRTVTDNKNTYWFLSPGLESLGRSWDFRVNGYIPISQTQKSIQTGYADEFGNYNDIQFAGHTEYDAILKQYETVGWGMDAEVGRLLPRLHGMRIYANTYHFNPNASAINGIGARVEYPLNTYLTLTGSDSYDNVQHNVALLGIRLTLGGLHADATQQPLQARLLDPITRNLATQSQGSGEPSVIHEEVIAPAAVEKDNIWFFEPSGGSDFNDQTSCTATQPCANFNQNTIDSINQIAGANPNFYFKPGDYTSENTGNGLLMAGQSQPLLLVNDSLFGRSQNYLRPETASVFTGAMRVQGTATLDSIILRNSMTTPQTVGLIVEPYSQLTLNDVQIGAQNSFAGYQTGIELQDSSLVIKGGSRIDAFTDTDAPAVGITGSGARVSISLADSQIIATGKSTVTNPTTDLQVYGINAGAQINIINLKQNALINANVTGNEANNVSAIGIAVQGKTNLISLSGNSQISATADAEESNHVSSIGILMDATAIPGAMNTVSLADNSQIIVNTTLENNKISAVNTLTAEGIAAFNGVSATTNVSLADTSKIKVILTDNDQSGVEDNISLTGIYAYGELNTLNTISLYDNSAVQVAANLMGQPSVVSNNISGIFVNAGFGDNTVNLQGNSAVQVNVNSAPMANGHNSLVVYGILASGKNNAINLHDQSSVQTQVDVESGRTNLDDVVAIAALQGNSTVTMSGNSQALSVLTMDNGATQNMGYATGLYAQGDENQINLLDASRVEAKTTIQSDGYNMANATGVYVFGTDNKIALSAKSLINVITNANGASPLAYSYGINSASGKTAIIDSDSSLSNIEVFADAPDGIAQAIQITSLKQAVSDSY